ncbi:MAG: glycosyltransferase family 39 protein [Anaerolineae bacterium]|nr:glycosyltransferase family 39 protein [Anaerolineae bacterium]
MTERKRRPVHKQRRVVVERAQVQRAQQARAARVRAWRVQLFTVVLLLFAVALRAANLTTQSLWADEGNSVRLSERRLPLIIDAARADVHPPGYYLLLWGWVRVFGQSEIAVRALSVVVGTATVWMVYLLGTRVWTARTGWLAAFCAAVSPFQVQYSQEVRMYILVAFLAAATLYALVRWLEASASAGQMGWGWGVTYVAAAAAGLWTHYSFPIVLVAVNAAVLCWLLASRGRGESANGVKGRNALQWAGLQVAALVLFVPWLPIAWARISAYGAISRSTPLVQVAGQWLKLLSVGESVATDDLAKWMTVGIAGLAVFGIWSGLGSLSRLRAGEWRSVAALGLTLVTVAPVVMMASLELAGRSAYRPKFFLVASPAFSVLVGAGISLLERPSDAGRTMANRLWLLLGIGLVGLASARSLRNYYADPAYARSDYRTIAATVSAEASAGDGILLNAPNQWEVFTYYYRGDLPVYPLCRSRPPVGDDVHAELEEIAAAHDRLYVVLWALDESDPERIVERWLQQHAYKLSDTWYGDVRLATYATAVDDEVALVKDALDDVRFGDTIALRAYRVAPTQLAPGDAVRVTLSWEALGVSANRYKVFLHLVAPDGQIASQYDGEPGGGLNPTTRWAPEQGVFAERCGLVVPRHASAGEYHLLMGLYDLSGAPRLPVSVAGEGAVDSIDLATVSVR